MATGFLDIAITPSVRRVQQAMGSVHKWAGARQWDRFTENEAAYIADRDSFYMATVSETGWPYLQHRGGPRGFLKLLDARTLAFADYRGNRQYLTTGNVAANDRACLFLMDYARRARLKIYVRAEVLAPDSEPALLERVAVPDYQARIERIFRLHLEAFDWNCPQHITPRFTEREIARIQQAMQQDLSRLQAENLALRKRLATMERTDD